MPKLIFTGCITSEVSSVIETFLFCQKTTFESWHGKRGLYGICRHHRPDQTMHLCSLIRPVLSAYRFIVNCRIYLYIVNVPYPTVWFLWLIWIFAVHIFPKDTFSHEGVYLFWRSFKNYCPKILLYPCWIGISIFTFTWQNKHVLLDKTNMSSLTLILNSPFKITISSDFQGIAT